MEVSFWVLEVILVILKEDTTKLLYQDRVTPWLNLPQVSWAQPKPQTQLTWGKLNLWFPWLNLPRVSWAQLKSQAQLTWGKLSQGVTEACYITYQNAISSMSWLKFIREKNANTLNPIYYL